ncbi:PrsW family glutamic-type intramembrane protease [Blastococcus sp. CCUG 61487]|uniref:PrsW family glutamic-type intramembrane protease n=1 Tax=Blastococcus sp. CCUG 61487 TaxID=1840703 RepID=UPI001484CDE9|nr:PrsW family glutamic-type intramembrane protease [Blastococcus sp. CCUG 61487]
MPASAAPSSVPGALDGVVAQFQRLPFAALLPLQSWASDAWWRQGRSALFLLMALAPFALLQATSEDADVERSAVGFAVYFAILWLVAIRELVQPEPLGWSVVAGISAFTAIAGVALAVAVEEQLGASTDDPFSSILTVGLPEEAAKAAAVLIFLMIGRGRWSPRTYLYAGAVSGLAFGAAEAVTYTTAYASFLDLEGGLAVTLWRLLCGSLFHACMAGIVAFFVGLGAWHRDVLWHLVVVGLLIAGVLHGLYNYFSDGWGGAVLAALTVFTFVGYARTGDRIAARLTASSAMPTAATQ